MFKTLVASGCGGRGVGGGGGDFFPGREDCNDSFFIVSFVCGFLSFFIDLFYFYWLGVVTGRVRWFDVCQ